MMTITAPPIEDQRLARFEALVQLQKPAETPWTPVTDYSFEARKQIEGIHPQLILQHLAPCEDADILDYGCGPDAHLVRLLREAARGTEITIRGYDPQIPGSESFLKTGGIYDLVIYREVNEHLTILQMAETVHDICRLSASLVYGTTRFHSHPRHLLDVETSDPLDPTHISLVTPTFLGLLFILNGFRARHDLAKGMDWMGKGRTFVYERASA